MNTFTIFILILVVFIIVTSISWYRAMPKEHTYIDPTYNSATTITIDDALKESGIISDNQK